MVAFVALFGVASTQAQILSGIEGMPPYKLGVTAGLNVPTFSHSGFDHTAGFQLGANLLLDGSEFVKNTYARVEVKYSMKGAYRDEKTAASDDPTDPDYWVSESRMTTHYLELPIHIGYAYYLNEDWTLLGEAGPYIAVGVGGRLKAKSALHYFDVEGEHIDLDNGSYSFFGHGVGRLDFGGGLHVGAIFNKSYQMMIGYDWGFINMHETMNQNRNLQLTFTYYFE